MTSPIRRPVNGPGPLPTATAVTSGALAPAPWLWWTAVKLAALPAVAWWVADALGLSPLERQVAVALAAVPTAPSAYILAMRMGGNGAAVALLISSGTLVAALTLPVWLGLIA